jgi:hypothetical protein
VIDYYMTVLRLRPEAIAPFALFLEPPSDRSAFIGRLEDIPLTVSVGYRALYEPRVRAITLVHGGLAGVDDSRSADDILGRLRDELRRGTADVVLLPALRTSSPLFESVASLRFPMRQVSSARTPHWVLRLPDSFDDFVRSRSARTRKNLRVYANRLHRERGDDLTMRVFRAPDEATELFIEIEKISRKTYQHKLGVAFGDTAEERELTLLGLRRGWFRAYMLYVRGEPAAYWLGSAYNGTFFTGTPGYDPAYADYSIGTYLLMRVIEDLCLDDTVRAIDYGFGDADYKRRFGSECWEEADVAVFAPRLRPIRINLTRALLVAGVELGKTTLERAGVARRLKRAWRRRL